MRVVLIPLLVLFGSSAYASADVKSEMSAYSLEKQRIAKMADVNHALKMRAEMAESLRKMADAGFLVDENGIPLGIEGDIQDLAKQIRDSHQNQAGPVMLGVGGGAMPDAAFPWAEQGQAAPMGQEPFAAPVKKEQDTPRNGSLAGYRLVEIGKSSVVVNGPSGNELVQIGDRVNGAKLIKVDSESAYFRADSKTIMLSIAW